MFNQHDLDRLLELSRLSIPPEQHESLARQIEDILGYVERLSAYDTSHVDVDLGETESVDSRRSDVSIEGLDYDAVDSCSNSFDNGYFLVPRILGDADGA